MNLSVKQISKTIRGNQHIIFPIMLVVAALALVIVWLFREYDVSCMNKKIMHFTYETNGGYLKLESDFYSGLPAIKQMPIPIRSGYSFMGWYTEKRNIDSYYGGYEIRSNKIKSDTDVFYARWAPTWFLQSDDRWGDLPFVNTSIRNKGCGPTVLAMVLFSLGYKDATPAKTCLWCDENGYISAEIGSLDPKFFVDYAKITGVNIVQLNYKKLNNTSKKYREKINKKAWDAVKKGNWVIAHSVGGNWAVRSHYFLWYDIEGENVLVRDPNITSRNRAVNKFSVLKKEAVMYWIVEIPEDRKLYTSESS